MKPKNLILALAILWAFSPAQALRMPRSFGEILAATDVVVTGTITKVERGRGGQFDFTIAETVYGEAPTSEPWLPQPASWSALTVEAQAADPVSMLSLYRSMLALRRTEPDLQGSDLRWLRTPADVLAFRRGERFVSFTNLSAAPVPLPVDGALLIASVPLVDGWLPVDATAWLRSPGSPESPGGGRG